jgi:hypothetical protein
MLRIVMTGLMVGIQIACASADYQASGGSQASSIEGSAPPTTAPALPEGLFVTSAPADAKNIRDAKPAAKKKEVIVLRGRIGGSVNPFGENRAMFTLVDVRIPACGEGDSKDDHCPTPHDMCCTPRSVLTANSATIQVVDEKGSLLKTSLKNVKGLIPLAEVTVKGTISQADGKAVLVINAAEIYVKPKS